MLDSVQVVIPWHLSNFWCVLPLDLGHLKCLHFWHSVAFLWWLLYYTFDPVHMLPLVFAMVLVLTHNVAICIIWRNWDLSVKQITNYLHFIPLSFNRIYDRWNYEMKQFKKLRTQRIILLSLLQFTQVQVCK